MPIEERPRRYINDYFPDIVITPYKRDLHKPRGDGKDKDVPALRIEQGGDYISISANNAVRLANMIVEAAHAAKDIQS